MNLYILCKAVLVKGILIVQRDLIVFSHYRNVACNRGKEEKANLIDSESLNVHIDYKKVSLCIILPLSNV